MAVAGDLAADLHRYAGKRRTVANACAIEHQRLVPTQPEFAKAELGSQFARPQQ